MHSIDLLHIHIFSIYSQLISKIDIFWSNVDNLTYCKILLSMCVAMCMCILCNIYVALGARGLINPIRSGIFQTANDPAPTPPPTISKTIVSIFTISYMCILLGVLGMFQLEFFLNLNSQFLIILTILRRFQNKK